MTTDRALVPHQLNIAGIEVAVVRKAIKNLHLGVYPPDGHVRVAAPLAVSDAAVRAAVIGKLSWIRRRQEAFAEQARESPREMVTGESHYFLGRRYRLEVLPTEGPQKVVLAGRRLRLYVVPGADTAEREKVLARWHRQQLREAAAPLFTKWEKLLGVQVVDWRIKRMKTKWGSCNAKAARVWLNIELIKKSPACLEYVVVHELAHLISPRHDEKFLATLDQHLPTWKHRRSELNASPLAAESWPARREALQAGL